MLKVGSSRPSYNQLVMAITVGYQLTYLYDYETLIITKCNIISVRADRNTPSALESVAERVLEPVRAAVPNLDVPVFTAADEKGEVGMELDEGNVVGVTLHRLHTTLAEVVPNFDAAVVGGGDEIGLV